MDERLSQVITRAERDAVMAPIESAMTLPSQAYSSAAWFDLEVERIFGTRWTAVMFESVLPNPGDATPFELFGMPLAAVRGADARLRVFHNICPYDGCIAVRSPARSLDHIDTYYHGWRYDLAGRLIAAPYWDGDPDCGPEGLGGRDGDLVEIRSEVRLGTLFINLDGRAEDTDAWLRPWVNTVGGHYAIDALVPAVDEAGRTLIEERTVAANWKTYQENASINILHEAFTHALYRKSPEVPRVDERGRARFETHLDGCLVAFSHRRADTGRTYDPMALPFAGHDPNQQPALGFFTTIYPNLNVPLRDAMVKVNIAIPVAPDETRLMHLRFYRPEALAADNFLAVEREQLERFKTVHYEDQLATEAVQRGRSSPAWRQHFYAPLWDAQHHRFNQLVMADMEKAG
jgi:phenylpropionate dioxygenase-like ring-hydroxylating dioxygenase large terminal subunit